MPYENADAIVLKTVDFSETSLILTLFSREFGKIRAIAKGGRRLKGPFESALDILSQIRVTFIRKNTDALDLLTEAKLQKRFYPTEKNYGGLYAAYYVVSLLNDALGDYEPAAALFDRTAAALNTFADGQQVQRSLVRFEWQLLETLGYLPTLRQCAECGTTVNWDTTKPITFGLLSGGVLCEECETYQPQRIHVSPETLRMIEQVCGDNENWQSVPIAKRSMGETRALLSRYFSCILERPPKMQRYFGIIQRNDHDMNLQ